MNVKLDVKPSECSKHQSRSDETAALLTSVDYLIFMTPVDRLDELVDVAADFIRWCAGGVFL